MNYLSPAEKREFLKSLQIEWQALLKRQTARVLSPEETVQARACWPDRAMDTGCVLGSQTKAGHRGAVQRRDLSLRVLQTL